jgi:lipase chaperone LimK
LTFGAKSHIISVSTKQAQHMTHTQMHTTIGIMPEHVKQRIAELTRQKIMLEDQLEYTHSFTRRTHIEQELYDVIHSITLLTHPYLNRSNV